MYHAAQSLPRMRNLAAEGLRACMLGVYAQRDSVFSLSCATFRSSSSSLLVAL